MLSCLNFLELEFQSLHSRPDWESRRPHPPKRSVIPALDDSRFKGVIEYLEDLVTFIDAPQLSNLYITSLNQINFDTPQLAQSIICAPTLRALDESRVQFDDGAAGVEHHYRTSEFYDLVKKISCREPVRQLSFVAQVCNSYLHFAAVKNLHVSKEIGPDITTALQELVGARITEVLPSLQNIFVQGLRDDPSGSLQENIWQFSGARRQSGHPITVSR